MKTLKKIAAYGWLISILIMGSQSIITSAQTPTATPAPAQVPSPNPAATTVTTVMPPKVTAVEGHLELDTIIQVQIDHFAEWVQKNDPSKLVPYLNGLAIHGNYPAEIHAS